MPFVHLCLIGFFTFFSYSLSRFPVIPLFASGFGVGLEAVGVAVAASTLTGVPGKIFFGALSDRIGRRRILVCATAIAALVPFAYPWLATSYPALVAIRFCHGLVTAMIGPSAHAIVSDMARTHERGVRLGTYSSSTMMGAALGPWLCGALLSWGGLRYPFLISGAVGVVACALAVAWRPSTAIASLSSQPMWHGALSVLRDRGIMQLGVVQACQYLATGCVEAFLPVYAKQAMGLAEWQIGWLFGIQVLGTMVSKPLMGRLADRLGRRAPMIGGFVLGAAVVWSVPWLRSFWALTAVAVVYGVAVATVTVAVAAYVTDLAGNVRYGAAHGILGTTTDVGHASGPLLGGLLIGWLGYHGAFALMSGLLLLAAVSVAGSRRDGLRS